MMMQSSLSDLDPDPAGLSEGVATTAPGWRPDKDVCRPSGAVTPLGPVCTRVCPDGGNFGAAAGSNFRGGRFRKASFSALKSGDDRFSLDIRLTLHASRSRQGRSVSHGILVNHLCASVLCSSFRSYLRSWDRWRDFETISKRFWPEQCHMGGLAAYSGVCWPRQSQMNDQG